MSFIVGIDGPAGTGKGTITNLVAKDLNLSQIDTGAMYRAFALYMLDNNVALDDMEKIKDLLDKVNIDLIQENDKVKYSKSLLQCLHVIEFFVIPVEPDKLFVCSPFHYLPFMHHADFVRVLYR